MGFLLYLLPLICSAQEMPPVQNYAHRLFLNPAFTGLLSDYSVTAGYRSQWTGLEGGYSTQWLSGEYRFSQNKNAVGATFMNDRSAGGGYSRLEAGALYAYHTKLRQKLDFSAGMQVGYGSLRPGFQDLVFEDQLGSNGTPQAPTAESFAYEQASYLTLTGGLLLFTNQFWLGLSAQRFNSPRVGTFPENSISPLWQVHTGYRFYLKNYFVQNTFHEVSVIPTVAYAQQSGFKRLDGSFYFVYTPITIGLTYSHLPNQNNIPSAHTMGALAGVTHRGFKLGYGYRQNLSGAPVSLGPTHEISISFEKLDNLRIYKRLGSDKNYNRIACPAF